MPAVAYRCVAHAVAGKGRYGYFERLEFRSKNGDELLLTTKTGEREWPLRVVAQAVIHNHEDLDKFAEGLMDLYNSLRGEHGEDEVRSPSVLVPFE